MEDRECEVKLFMENQKLKSEVERLKKYHAITEHIEALREISLHDVAQKNRSICWENKNSEFGNFIETTMSLAEEVGYDNYDLISCILQHTSNDVRDDILIDLKQREETGKMP